MAFLGAHASVDTVAGAHKISGMALSRYVLIVVFSPLVFDLACKILGGNNT
jgi:hypothetical protein